MLTATVCIALSAAGLAVSFLTAWKRRFLRATRLAAWSLLPVGLYLAGLLPLFGEIGEAVGTWAADLVLKPTVWVGMAVLAVSVLLFVITRFAGRRRAAGSTRQVAEPRAGTAVAGRGATGALGSGTAGGDTKKRETAAADDLGDFREIEEILRRRGI